ncbi:PPPDE putative thiol peptidase family protein [Forsythia ovata]|uniref:PPPDE putative thiol peptidase family protein n=1 Tax=Forsythia ovata TaxID=205694 RepID=A0ABD1Q0J9_9LAMI
MKSKLSNSWHSIVPLHVQGESANNFCVFPKVNSASDSPGNFPIYLNVYDLTLVNGYFYWAGVGVFHSGVEVHGVEYAFGAHDYPSSGVFEIEPRQCPGFKFRKSILMGTTYLNPNEIKEFMERQTANYNGDTYHLIVKNCNHFCEDICYKLTGNRIPKWVHSAIVFFRRPLNHLLCDMVQIVKALAAGRRVEGALLEASRQFPFSGKREKCLYLHCSYTSTIKAAYLWE